MKNPPPPWQILRLHKLDAKTGATLDNGCRFVECLPPGPLGDVDVTHITVPANSRTAPHRHRKSTCFVFVVDGSGFVRLDGRRERVALNDFVLIEPRTVHAFEANGEPLTLLSVHSPSLSADGDADIEYCREAGSEPAVSV